MPRRQAPTRAFLRPLIAPAALKEDRSRETRQRLLNATIEVLMREGYQGLSTKEVARAAGLSNGALAHHYTNKLELVAAAAEAAYEECLKRRYETLHSATAMDDPIRGFIGDSLNLFFDRPFLAILEISIAARTDPVLFARIKPVMKRYRNTFDAYWLDIFCQAGYSRPTAMLVLNLTLNLTRGMALNRLWQKDEESYRTCLNEWVQIVYRLFPLPQVLPQ